MNEGWTEIYPTSRKFHYFRNRKSLCGRFALIGNAVLEPDDGKPAYTECVACRKKLESEKKKAGKAES